MPREQREMPIYEINTEQQGIDTGEYNRDSDGLVPKTTRKKVVEETIRIDLKENL
jgi:hypothetical protein